MQYTDLEFETSIQIQKKSEHLLSQTIVKHHKTQYLASH